MSASFREAIVYTNSKRALQTLPTDFLIPGWHSFDTGYVSLNYQVFGNTGPLIIVQVPGWGIGPSYLSNGLSPLHSSFRMLYFVPRGTKPSSRPISALDMSSAHMVEDLEALRQYLGLANMTLLGHSNGGSIALAYSQQYPNRVQKMVLLDHELQGFDDSTTFMEFTMRRKNDPVYKVALEQLQNFSAESDEEMAERLTSILPFYLADPTRSLPAMLETMEGSLTSWALNAQREADRRNPTYLEDDLEMVEARTLIIVGRQDPFCSVRAAERAHVGIEASRLMIFEDCGHFPWIERREECVDVIGDFLLA